MGKLRSGGRRQEWDEEESATSAKIDKVSILDTQLWPLL